MTPPSIPTTKRLEEIRTHVLIRRNPNLRGAIIDHREVEDLLTLVDAMLPVIREAAENHEEFCPRWQGSPLSCICIAAGARRIVEALGEKP